MFFKLLILFIFTSLFVSSAPNLSRVDINCDKIGPYYKNQEANTKVDVAFYIAANFDATFRVYVGLPNGYGFFCYGSETFLATPGLIRTFEFPFPTNYLSSDEYIDISFRVYSGGGANATFIKQQVDFSIKVVSSKVINVNNLENKIYSSDRFSLRIEKNIVIYNDETYDFSYLGEDITEENYLYIDFKNIRFKYTSEYEYTYSNVRARFIDYYNNFPFLLKIGKFTLIDLVIQYDKNMGLYYLNLADGYYFDVDTHEMKLSKDSNSKATSLFFLPKNKQDEFEGTNINFTITSSGYEQNNFSFNLTYYYGKLIIGDCNTSDYCIVGELYG